MRRTTSTAGAGLAGALVFLAAFGPARSQEKVEKKEAPEKAVKALMLKAHKGDNAPLANVGKQLKTDSPDWTLVGRDVKVLTDMAELLRDGSDRKAVYYASPAGYITSAQNLDKAARAKDHKAASEALAGLNRSCSACHAYGGLRK